MEVVQVDRVAKPKYMYSTLYRKIQIKKKKMHVQDPGFNPWHHKKGKAYECWERNMKWEYLLIPEVSSSGRKDHFHW